MSTIKEKKSFTYWQIFIGNLFIRCECSLVASNQGDNPTMKYKITYYKNGKAIVVKFATLSAAKQAAHDLFECIGVVAGIESIA